MIKLNLLPAWYAGRKLSGQLLLLAVVITLGVCAVEYLWLGQIQRDTAQTIQQAEFLEAWKSRVDGINAQAVGELSQIQPITDKLNFFNGVLKYNSAYPALYDKVVKWTYKNVTLSSMTSDGSTVSMQAHANNLQDFARYMLNMYRATDMFTQVTISNITVNRPGAGGAAAGGMPGMGPGAMPGRPGMPPMPGGAAGPPMPMVGPMARPGGMPGMGAGAAGPPMPMAGPMARPAGMPGPGGMPGMPGAGLAGVGAAGGGTSASGVDFSVTCTLVDTLKITAPTPAGGGAAAPAAGGMMGAMPGVPGPGVPGPGMMGPGGMGGGGTTRPGMAGPPMPMSGGAPGAPGPPMPMSGGAPGAAGPPGPPR